MPDATPTPASSFPDSGERLARLHVTDELLAWSAHWELRRRGTVLGVYGFSDLHGWWCAVSSGDGWRTLARAGSSEEARQRVQDEAGRGRWVHVDSLHDTAW